MAVKFILDMCCILCCCHTACVQAVPTLPFLNASNSNFLLSTVVVVVVVCSTIPSRVGKGDYGDGLKGIC